ncbi:unnamed protein product [Menidia menidia]|uniref:(Atlantic silverside) hypothetical protein n=1 Tax=Menidia menidia TaxID=238744 RepID=A0A8S4AZ29_9TELE|nr:unnamed protein product [Menidia menidia]
MPDSALPPDPLDCLPGLDPCSPLDPVLDYPSRIVPGLTPRCRPCLPDHPLWFAPLINQFELTVCLRVFLGPLSRTLQYVLANMDPNPDGQWRAGVEKSIAQLEACVTEILNHVRDLASPAAPLPQASPPAPVSPPVSRSPPEPRLAPPGSFGGDPEQCRAFLTQCEINFEVQPSCFPTDRARVAYVISLLEGKARLWGASEWQNDTAVCYSYPDFAQELTRVFSPVLPCRDTSDREPPDRLEASAGQWLQRLGCDRTHRQQQQHLFCNQSDCADSPLHPTRITADARIQATGLFSSLSISL